MKKSKIAVPLTAALLILTAGAGCDTAADGGPYITDSGSTWRAANTANSGFVAHASFFCVAYGEIAGKGMFVAGTFGGIAYSTDGIIWKSADTSASGFGAITSMAYGHAPDGLFSREMFVAVGDGGKIAYSSNGTIWKAADTSASGFGATNITGVAYGAGPAGSKWVAVGGNRIAYSADGITWKAANTAASGFGSDSFSCVAYGGDKWIACGSTYLVPSSPRIATSTDGITWTAVTNTILTIYNYGFAGVAYGGGRWVAVPRAAINPNTYTIPYSLDGTTWMQGSSTGFPIVSSLRFDGVAYGSGKFVAVGTTSGSLTPFIVTSTNGINWKQANISAGGFASGTYGNMIRGVTYGGGKWVAVADTSSSYPGRKIAYSVD
jgi:hypothetical protein